MTPQSLDTRVTVLERESGIYRIQQSETNTRVEKKLDDFIEQYQEDRKADKTTSVALMVAMITTFGTVAAAAIALIGIH